MGFNAPTGAPCHGEALIREAIETGAATKWMRQSSRRLRERAAFSEDTLQEVSLVIWQEREHFRGRSKEELRGWIQVITRHVTLERIERQRARETRFLAISVDDSALGNLASSEPGPGEASSASEESELLLRAIDALEVRIQRAVLLAVVRGVPLSDLSHVLGLSRRRLYEIRKQAFEKVRYQFSDSSDP